MYNHRTTYSGGRRAADRAGRDAVAAATAAAAAVCCSMIIYIYIYNTQKISNKMVSTKIVHTSGIVFLKFSKKCSKIHLTYVPIYSQIHRIRIRYSK